MRKLQFGLCLTLIAFSQAALADTHCSNTEKVVFSCSFGKKMVSICASSDLSASAGYMQYRFGAKDKVELQYPQTQLHPRGKFDVKRQTPVLDNGTRAKLTEVSFVQGDFKYIVDSMDTGSIDKTTLNVERNGKQLASLVCNNASIVNKDFSYYEILDSFVDVNNAAPAKQTVAQSSPPKQAAPQPSTTALSQATSKQSEDAVMLQSFTDNDLAMCGIVTANVMGTLISDLKKNKSANVIAETKEYLTIAQLLSSSITYGKNNRVNSSSTAMKKLEEHYFNTYRNVSAIQLFNNEYGSICNPKFFPYALVLKKMGKVKLVEW